MQVLFSGARNVGRLRKCPKRTFLRPEFVGYAHKLSRFSSIRSKYKFEILIKALFINKKGIELLTQPLMVRETGLEPVR